MSSLVIKTVQVIGPRNQGNDLVVPQQLTTFTKNMPTAVIAVISDLTQKRGKRVCIVLILSPRLHAS